MDSGSEHMTEQGVGALLQASRLRCGEDLQDIAHHLRIRYTYLQALEDGRVKDLPGLTYAIGFIRAYSEYLGLDSNEIVRRFKSETSKVGRKTELVFPTPIPEGGIPGGAIILVGVFVAALAYGGWYVSTVREGLFDDYIAPIPDRLMAMISLDPAVESLPAEPEPPLPEIASEAPSPAEPSPSSATAAVPAMPMAEIPTDTPAVATAPAPPAMPVPNVEVAALTPPPPASTPPETPSAPPAPVAPAPLTPETARAPAPVSPQAPAEATRVAPPAAPSRVVEPTAAEQALLDVPAAPPAPPQAPPQISQQAAVSATPASDDGRVFGMENENSRITLRATMDSWIQIRDSIDNRLVMTRLMRTGDRYRVPAQEALVLVTGNAGALEIIVDGAPVPSLGPVGAVRRNVLLDAEKLLAGSAAQN